MEKHEVSRVERTVAMLQSELSKPDQDLGSDAAWVRSLYEQSLMYWVSRMGAGA